MNDLRAQKYKLFPFKSLSTYREIYDSAWIQIVYGEYGKCPRYTEFWRIQEKDC
jgi:hypothetical protein